LLVDFLITISLIAQAIVVMRSSRKLEASESNISLLFIASVIARWLAGVLAHITLLSGEKVAEPDGLIISLFFQILKGYSVITMTFAFLSLAVLNMMITSRGISRATEVTARFYLDSVPGRQIAVDADLASGAINYETANRRRVDINLKSSQYSMMDGISKFMAGEGITSSLILILSVVFSIPAANLNPEGVSKLAIIISIGIMWQILQFASAMCYSYLLMAISKEVVDTNSGPKRLDWTNGIVVFAGLIFSLFAAGHYLYVLIGVSALFLCKRYLYARYTLKVNKVVVEEKIAVANQLLTPLSIEIDPIYAMQIGCENPSIINQIRFLRERIEQDLGFQFPAVMLIDSTLLMEGEYTINIHGTRLAHSKQVLSSFLAVPGDGAIALKYGQPAQDPVFGIRSFWIRPVETAVAIRSGYTVTDNAGVILTHLAKIIKEKPHKALFPQETQRLLKVATSTKRIPEIDTSLSELPLNTVHLAFVHLLEEGFSLTNMSYILNLLSEAVQLSLRRVDEVTAYLRHALAIDHLAKLSENQGKIDAIAVSSTTTRDLEEIFVHSENDHQYAIKKDKLMSIFNSISQKSKSLATGKSLPILIAKAALRSNLAASLRANSIPLFVASFDEIGANTSINIIETI
jgi:flagellar biosynthesis protein FlhA